MPGIVIKVWELWPSAAQRVALRLPWKASFNRFINTPTNRLTTTCFRYVAVAYFTLFVMKDNILYSELYQVLVIVMYRINFYLI